MDARSSVSRVSVIVPVYGVESFVERCVRSLMEQTLDNIEYIFIDDATKDNSVAIIERVIKEYPQRLSYIKILHHKVNKGLPAARNTGLAVACGEYIFHCDSDDYVEPNMLEQLYNAAKKENVDIVWCDWFLTFVNSERYMRQPFYETPVDALKAMLGGAMKYNVWNKLVRRSLYTDYDIEFPAGYGMGEDMTMIMLMSHAKSVSYVPYGLYHYVKTNTSSFSQTYSDAHIVELKYNADRIITFIKEKYNDKYISEIGFFKLEVKFPFLLMNPADKFLELWDNWYPEANEFISRNKNISLRSRVLQLMAAKHLWWGVKLYNIAFKSVYNFIFNK